MSYTIAAETEQPRCIELGMTGIPVFKQLPDEREQALKPLEEAAEVFGAWQTLKAHPSRYTRQRVIDEICDTLQACANLLAAIGEESIEDGMARVRKRNEARGRIYG